EVFPTQAVLHVPGGSLSRVLVELSGAHELDNLADYRVFHKRVERNGLEGNAGAGLILAVIETDGRDFDFLHLVGSHVEHATAHAATHAAHPSATHATPHHSAAHALHAATHATHAAHAATSTAAAATLRQNRHAAKGFRQLDRERLVGLVFDHDRSFGRV